MDYRLYLRDTEGRIDDAIPFRCCDDRRAAALARALDRSRIELWRGALCLLRKKAGGPSHPLLAALPAEPVFDRADMFDPLLARIGNDQR